MLDATILIGLHKLSFDATHISGKYILTAQNSLPLSEYEVKYETDDGKCDSNS